MKDYFNYSGKTCIVTGAASGMGKATAEMLIDLGAKVYALDYAEVKLDGIEAGYQVNLGERNQIDEVFEHLPEKIDSFFGVAGVSGVQHDFDTTITINYIANKYITEKYLKERMNENGSIAFVTSLGGLYWDKYLEETAPLVDAEGWEETLEAIKNINLANRTGGFGYALSKRLLNQYTAKQVFNFMQKKVRINTIMPAATQTGLTDEFSQLSGGMDNMVSKITARLATSEEMAQPLVFLNSDMASYISGVTLSIDAGETAMEILGTKESQMNFPFVQKDTVTG